MSSLEFRLKKIDETRNYLSDEIDHKDLMSEKYKKTCKYLNYVEHVFILVSAVNGGVSVSVFASLVCVAVGITSSSVGLKICAITTGLKKYNSIIKKEKKKNDKIMLLDATEVLISKSLIDSYINHDEFVSVNNVLKEYNEMKEETKK